ncbi:MAG TPA: aldehyde dehydrogenase family protein [Thauera aminoaromatica]|nr:aldehyde dehydrogenase family protein [Thauera aminoaromatica]
MATSLQQQHPAPSEFSGERIAVRNPRSGQVDHHFTAPSRAELEGMVGGLRRAQVAWREAPLQHRIDVLRRWRAEFARRQGEIAAALAVDTGRHLIATAEATSVLGMIDH